DLLFYLRPSPLISEIQVVGAKKVPSAQILSASRIRRGTSIDERDFREAETAVSKLLEKRGFTAASVSVSATCNLENGSGKVRIEIREGPPVIVRSVSLPGAVFFPQERLLEILGTSPGSPFDYKRWDAGIRKLRVAYKKSGYLTVRISEADFACENGDGFCLSARVEEGPRYDVLWEGRKRYSVARLEKASGIYGEEETTEGGLMHDMRERLLAFYRDHDYLLAEVDLQATERGEGLKTLTITVREGVAGHLKEIQFTGNATLSAKQLRKQMTSEEKGPLSFLTGSGKFREEEWNDDLNALVGLYQKEGFVHARVTAVDNEWDAKGAITETIHIEEGPRYRLREIRFRGNDHFLRDELMALVGNREGKFVDYVGVELEQESIASHYRNAGYLDVGVAAELLFDEGKDTTVAQFTIEEGPRYRLGKVVVQGNLQTDPVVVLREVGISEGSPAGEKDLLKFQQAVYRTGLYKSVRVQKIRRPPEGILDLVVEVEETLFFEIEFGAGYGTDTGVRGFAGTKHRNLDGKGRAFIARINASEKEQKYIGDLREPWILGNRWKWEGGLTAYYQEAERVSFSLRKASVIASVNRTFFERSTLSLQYEVSRDHVFNVAPGAVLSREDQG
ncbi:MAG TPA: POTRA domain-containing protein, partial [Candidatus Limnocylindrales bacterium]|nr:POTRA domain-containing protein [Candidatus Limnocylindrales bacterium]